VFGGSHKDVCSHRFCCCFFRCPSLSFVVLRCPSLSFVVLRCPSLSFVVLLCSSSQQDTGAPKVENEEGAAGGDLSESVSGTAAREKLIQAEATRQRERRRALVNCNYHDRPELFDVGETSKEKKLRVLLSTSNPTQNALLKHLTAMHRDLTKKRGKRTVAVQWRFSGGFLSIAVRVHVLTR
jgi:hypothetical protein